MQRVFSGKMMIHHIQSKQDHPLDFTLICVGGGNLWTLTLRSKGINDRWTVSFDKAPTTRDEMSALIIKELRNVVGVKNRTRFAGAEAEWTKFDQ